MRDYVVKGNKKMRQGVTTGACAAGATKAAAMMLLGSAAIEEVKLEARTGKILRLEIVDREVTERWVQCSVIKDAGDDPDVTHGLKIFAKVWKIPQGIEIDGGEGVGRVTQKGLKIPVGSAAINEVPLAMISEALLEIGKHYRYNGGFGVEISVPEGERVAKETMNSRLGIIGGISILGTTGIVEPMSERAIIDTIKKEMDIMSAKGFDELLISPGNYGEDFASNELKLDTENLIKCSNYIGEMLDYARYLKIRKIRLVGHLGKLVKLAAGIMNTYSKVADGRMEILTAHAALSGVATPQLKTIMQCITVDAVLDILKAEGVLEEVMASLSERIAFYLEARTRGEVAVEFDVYTLDYGRVIHGQT